MIKEILSNVSQFKRQISALRSDAPLYPIVSETMNGGVYWVTSIVVFEHEGKKYKRHHVESCILNEYCSKEQTLKRFKNNCELTMRFGHPNFNDEEV